MSRDITNILLCGIGGQGVMTAAEALAQVAVRLGHDVKKTEVAGMAQRGGVVTSHVRFGPKVMAAAIPPGAADILIGFEAAEAMRWAGQVRAGGIALVNTMRVAPPVVSGGLFPYPADPVATIRGRDLTVQAFDAEALARQLGNMRLINTIMLGAVADRLPFGADILKEAVVERFRVRKPHLADLNARAFEAGRAAAGARTEAA